MKYKEIWRGWGISKTANNKWFVLFGGEYGACCGIYRNRRRAKLEISYIRKGCVIGPWHGAIRYIKVELL